MTHPKLNLDNVRTLFSETIFQRGRNYYAIGAVHEITLRDDLLLAEVEGSEDEYYKVVIQFEQNQLSTAECSCPYGDSFGGYCKHIAAALLTYIDKPETVIHAEGISIILETLSEKQLRGALEHLLTLYPEAIDRLELYLKTGKLAQKNRSQKPPTLTSVSLDTSLYEKMMHTTVLGSSYDWDGYPEYDEVFPVIDEVKPFLERGDYAEALVLTEKLIQAFIDAVESSQQDYNSNIGFSDENIFSEFDNYLVEAIYGTKLTDDDRRRLLHKILEWHDAATNEWTDPDLNMSAYALIESFEALEAEAEELIQEVTRYERDYSAQSQSEKIRLKVMQKTGDLKAGLQFAKETGHGADYLIILYEQEKLDQVMAEYKSYIDNDETTLNVIEHLATLHPQEAIEIGSYGLSKVPRSPSNHTSSIFGDEGNLERIPHAPHRRKLATFCKELAKENGDSGVQLDASIIEFQYAPSLKLYLDLKVVAKSSWGKIKKALLKGLVQQRFGGYQQEAAVDIFIHEKLHDQAITIVSKDYMSETLIQKVMTAVVKTHPDWVKTLAEKKAEEVMDATKAKYYYHAVRWLECSKAAYLAHGHKSDWDNYMFGIRAKHGRKPKLMSLTKDL